MHRRATGRLPCWQRVFGHGSRRVRHHPSLRWTSCLGCAFDTPPRAGSVHGPLIVHAKRHSQRSCPARIAALDLCAAPRLHIQLGLPPHRAASSRQRNQPTRRQATRRAIARAMPVPLGGSAPGPKRTSERVMSHHPSRRDPASGGRSAGRRAALDLLRPEQARHGCPGASHPRCLQSPACAPRDVGRTRHRPAAALQCDRAGGPDGHATVGLIDPIAMLQLTDNPAVAA